MNLVYEAPGDGGKTELLAAIESGVTWDIAAATVAAAFNVDDPEWLQDQFVRLLSHGDERVQATAAIGLAHVARIHRHLDTDLVLPLLQERRRASDLGQFGDAIEDIEALILGIEPAVTWRTSVATCTAIIIGWSRRLRRRLRRR